MRRRLVGLLAFEEHTLVPGGSKAVVSAYPLGPWRYKSSSWYRTERGNASDYANTEAKSSQMRLSVEVRSIRRRMAQRRLPPGLERRQHEEELKVEAVGTARFQC